MSAEDEDLITCLWCQQSTPHETAMGACCWEKYLEEHGRYRKALRKLACLGNGDRPGNSIGNQIAIDALKGA